MASKLKAVLDSGPLIHTREAGAFEWTKLFSKILYPPAVYRELRKRRETQEALTRAVFKEQKLTPQGKKQAELLYLKYGLSVAESEAITLARREKISLVLTDDLEARITAEKLGVTPAGSVGLLLRAYREKIIDFRKLEGGLKNLLHNSSLFITPYLIQEALREATKISPRKR